MTDSSSEFKFMLAKIHGLKGYIVGFKYVTLYGTLYSTKRQDVANLSSIDSVLTTIQSVVDYNMVHLDCFRQCGCPTLTCASGMSARGSEGIFRSHLFFLFFLFFCFILVFFCFFFVFF